LFSLKILQTLIKLDIFFIASYAIQLIPSKSIGYPDSIFEIVSIFIGGFIMLLMAWYSVSKEMKYVLLAVIILTISSLPYMIYRLVRINLSRSENDPYKFTRRSLTFTLCVSLGLVSVSIYYGIICFRNMNCEIYVYRKKDDQGSVISLD